MAYDRYNQEGQDLLNMYNLYMDREQLAYGQHQDTVDNWYREDARLTDNYNTLYNQEYDNWYTGVDIQHGDYNTQHNMDFQADEAEKDREFTENENQKDRDAADARASNGNTTGNVWNTSSVSVSDIIDKCSKYKKQGNNEDMAAYLDGLVASGSISQSYADELYAQYRTDNGGGNPVDTSVDLNGDGTISKDELIEAEKKRKASIFPATPYDPFGIFPGTV